MNKTKYETEESVLDASYAFLRGLREVQKTLADELPDPIHSYRSGTLYLVLLLEVRAYQKRHGHDPNKLELAEALHVGSGQHRIDSLIEKGLLVGYDDKTQDTGKRCVRVVLSGEGRALLAEVATMYTDLLPRAWKRMKGALEQSEPAAVA